MMKHKYTRAILLALTALLTLVIMPAQAQQTSRYSFHSGITNEHKVDQIGVGVQVGANTGLTADYWLSETNTANATLTGIGGNLGIGGSYDWMIRNAFGSGEVAREFVPFVGAGALGVFGTKSDSFDRRDQNFALAIQMPVGVEFLPSTQRFAVFAKLSPSVEVTPYGYFFINGDAGARFYF